MLRDVRFDCKPGEFVAVVGPSGCGKSTLLRLIAGLARPSAGDIAVGDPKDAPRLGYVFQDATLLPWRNVRGNIGLPLELAHVDAKRRTEAIARARQLVGLMKSDEKKLPRALSGGMRMRVSLARALVTEPQVMLLDEPFAAVDDILRHKLNEQVHQLWMDQCWTTVMVTHNVAEAVFLSQRILIMAGKPARIVDEIAVGLAYPRITAVRSESQFASIVGYVSQRLRDAIEMET